MADAEGLEAIRDRAVSLFEDLVVDFATYGRAEFLPDMPVRLSVWRAFAEKPAKPHTILIELNPDTPVDVAVRRIRDALRADKSQPKNRPLIVVGSHARFSADLDDMSDVLFPCTRWYQRRSGKKAARWLAALRRVRRNGNMGTLIAAVPDPPLWRFVAGWTAITNSLAHADQEQPDAQEKVRLTRLAEVSEALCKLREGDSLDKLPNELGAQLLDNMRRLLNKLSRIKSLGPAPITAIDFNRPANLAVALSRQTVKIDAAERLFEATTKDISWAVIDSGVDATHPAFSKTHKPGKPVKRIAAADSRVVATYDFNRLLTLFTGQFAPLLPKKQHPALQALVDPDDPARPNDLDEAVLMALFQRSGSTIDRRLSEAPLLDGLADPAFRDAVKDYAGDVKRRISEGEVLDWPLLEPLLRLSHDPALYYPPGSGHGTHVAGTIGANLPAGAMLVDGEEAPEAPVMGMCPDVQLYDLRVCDEEGQSDEFLVMAALQFVGWVNRSQANLRIHGVNVSLQIAHQVRNYGCGNTPVCNEANALVANGVVVVVAAGNRGFNELATRDGLADSYAWSSIMDPGNAADVITVGSTHKEKPHRYGVSYFSSRGPTGDGRQKPDLVAPGEKIVAPYPGTGTKSESGTSMAAPHVSGAAALLMARHPELVGQPQRIKSILCDTATDLERRREFQGAGLVDVLRALQSV